MYSLLRLEYLLNPLERFGKINSPHSFLFPFLQKQPLFTITLAVPIPARDFRRICSRAASSHWLAIGIVFLLVLVQFLSPRFELVFDHPLYSGSLSSRTLPNQGFSRLYSPFADDNQICLPRSTAPPITSPSGTFNKPYQRSMTLVQEAQKVAREFEYPASEVQKGVKRFREQMREFEPSRANDFSRSGTYLD